MFFNVKHIQTVSSKMPVLAVFLTLSLSWNGSYLHLLIVSSTYFPEKLVFKKVSGKCPGKRKRAAIYRDGNSTI